MSAHPRPAISGAVSLSANYILIVQGVQSPFGLSKKKYMKENTEKFSLDNDVSLKLILGNQARG